MNKPIRPEDHSLHGNKYILGTLSSHTAEGQALIEAIRQTFERDALWLKHKTKFEQDYKGWEQGGKRLYEQPVPPLSVSDPNTEIDRTARLLVDAEYRRRAEESEQEDE